MISSDKKKMIENAVPYFIGVEFQEIYKVPTKTWENLDSLKNRINKLSQVP